jgi:hypothetical protein
MRRTKHYAPKSTITDGLSSLSRTPACEQKSKKMIEELERRLAEQERPRG